jgi:putative PIN family toxin of toxin-antitoxin system
MTPAVFDCVVLLQAAANPFGPAGACLAFVETGDVNLFLSAAVLEEARDVFLRPATRKRFPQLTDEKVDRFLLKVATLSTFVQDVPATTQLSPDPKDERYLHLAMATQASFIVSRDNHLLDLMKDDAFRKACPAITIVDPPVFLVHVRAEVASKPSNE